MCKSIEIHLCVEKTAVCGVWPASPRSPRLCGTFHRQGLNCHLPGEVMKGSRTLLPLAVASLFPQSKPLSSRDPHSDTAERLAPRQEHYHSFLQRRAFLEYVKREIASSTQRRLVSAVNGGLRAATYGDAMAKHTMAHWNISSFQHSCSQQTAQYEQHCAP